MVLATRSARRPEERAYGTLRLLTLATLRLPDLFLYAHVLQVFDEDPDVERVPPVVVGAVRTIASGALRLAHRALVRRHARNVGYETGAWVDRALEQAGAWLCCEVDVEVPVLLDQARRAAIALTRATAATADDRMLVPEELANGLGHLLAIYLIATTTDERAAPRCDRPSADLGPPRADDRLSVTAPGGAGCRVRAAPTEADDRSEQAGAAARVLPPSPTTATQAQARPVLPALRTGQTHQRWWLGTAGALEGGRARRITRPCGARSASSHRRRRLAPTRG